MAHTWIYGKFNFYRKHNKEELRKFAYDMILKSVVHQFGLKFCSNLSSYRLQKMDLSDCQAGNCLLYEITDDPLSNECYDIYDGIWIGAHDLTGIENSRLMDLERFLSDVFSHEMIASIDCCTEDVHGDDRAETTACTIKPNELCRILPTAPEHTPRYRMLKL